MSAPFTAPHMPAQTRPEERARLQALHAQQEKVESERLFREKTRALKPTDKTIPPGVEDWIVGDGVDQYNKIREVESRLDAIMMRKRLDLLDPVQNAIEKFVTLKIWISNTVENQPWQNKEMDASAFDFNDGNDATYRVKIEGRIIEDEDLEKGDEEDGDGNDSDAAMDIDGSEEKPEKPAKSSENRFKLSHFFKKITIDFDRHRSLQPDGMTQIEWKKPSSSQSGSDFDSLEFERKSDENINIKINLYRDEKQERHQLSPELGALLDADAMEKSAVIDRVWEYIKLTGLQKDEPRRMINCDDTLKAVNSPPAPLPFYPFHILLN